MPRRVTVLLVLNLILSLAALGGLAWIVVEPERWFDDIYTASEQAEEAAINAEAAVEEVESTVLELQESVEAIDVSSLEEVDVYELESRLSDVESTLGEVESDLSSICSELSLELDLTVFC